MTALRGRTAEKNFDIGMILLTMRISHTQELDIFFSVKRKKDVSAPEHVS